MFIQLCPLNVRSSYANRPSRVFIEFWWLICFSFELTPDINQFISHLILSILALKPVNSSEGAELSQVKVHLYANNSFCAFSAPLLLCFTIIIIVNLWCCYHTKTIMHCIQCMQSIRVHFCGAMILCLQCQQYCDVSYPHMNIVSLQSISTQQHKERICIRKKNYRKHMVAQIICVLPRQYTVLLSEARKVATQLP